MNTSAPLTPLPPGHAYRIPQFDAKHSNGELRKRDDKDWFFVVMPTSLDSLTLRRLLQLERGPAAFGVYVLLVEIAANGRPERGILARDSGPLSPTDLSLLTSLPMPSVESGLQLLLGIGWLDIVEITPAATTATPATPRDDTGDPQAPAAAPHTATLRDDTSDPAHAAGTGTPRPIPPHRDCHSQPTGNGNTNPPPHIGLVGNSSNPGGAGGGSVAGLLLRIGVQPKARREIVAAGKTGAEVVAAWAAANADKKVEEPAAVLRHRLTSADVRPAKLTTKGLMTAIRQGVVVRVAGVSIDHPAQAKHNSAGVTYRGQLIAPAERIKTHELEVA